MRRRLGLILCLAVAALAGALPAATAAGDRSPAVPPGFVGVDVDGPMIAENSPIDVPAQMRAMVAAGVETVRYAFNWAAAEPYRTLAQVPSADRSDFTVVAGVPVDFAATDAIVAAAAARGLAVLPTILYAPAWDAVRNPDGVDFPRTPAPYAAYAAALVGRYGPAGSFWSAHPSLPRRPIEQWQIWNEPNLAYYWHQPFESGYAALLAAAHAAIKRADPHAQVVLGALTNRAWASLALLQAHRPQVARSFDIAAVNGFTRLPVNVIRYLRYMRRAMDRNGDRAKPLLATEVSWPSALHHTKNNYDFDTTEAGQARNIAALLPMLGATRRQLNLIGFDLYTWMGAESPGAPAFDFAGLVADRDGRIQAKPALGAFRAAALRLEHCASKGPLATDCRR
jgi:hypothetical protein